MLKLIFITINWFLKLLDFALVAEFSFNIFKIKFDQASERFILITMNIFGSKLIFEFQG